MSLAFTTLLKRDLRLIWQGRARLLPLFAYPLLILLIAVFAVDIRTLDLPVRKAFLLVALVLAQLTLLPLAWKDELQSGVLVQLWMARRSLLSAVWARYSACILALLLPLAMLVMVMGDLLLHIPARSMSVSIFLGLPTLLGLALLAGALTVGLNSNTALPALLLLPLYVPLVILMALGATATDAAVVTASHYWLAALAALSFGLLPFGISAALRQALAS